MLYIVPTPIGNLKDITLRALDVLRSVSCILAEDTRVTAKLLKEYGIETRLRPYHAHNEHKIYQSLIDDLEAGNDVALVSDAGMPAVSDPGFLLVRACREHHLPVEVLPGATAFLVALIKSGFPTDRFVFEGVLPHKKGRLSRIGELKDEKRTVIFYESPHRLIKFLEQFRSEVGDGRELSVSRELTKKFEETRNGTASELIDYFNTHTIKGEFVICIKGKE